MKKIETINELRDHLRPLRQAGRIIGFVPTMGALHAGHRSLMQAARSQCDELVVSIFVNPTQFSPGEDYDRYPRPMEDDLDACRAEKVDTVFCPGPKEVYPPEAATTVQVTDLTERLCGAHRPGHFTGVTTVVAKLFNMVGPDLAFFGQKDAQQAAVIRRMTCDLNFPIEIVVCPTIRGADGLALSSRNAYLSPQERQQALCLYRSLQQAKADIESGQRDAVALVIGMRRLIESAGPSTIDYIEIVDPLTLQPKKKLSGECLIALAVRIGPARLIDNLLVDVGDRQR
jgi:pantoate--beta-alanine ligase